MMPPEDPLKNLLHQWPSGGEAPRDFQRAVWQRIHSQQRFTLSAWLERLSERLMLVPKSISSAALVVLTLSSAWTGYTSALQHREQNASFMASAFLDSIDPVARAARP